ncbi:unnamed protein product [Allacma fusca]|uniref:Uncharacterized protein n=1 Tax=Allacma fusca TaxID=39272 RepID=A0A8J2PCA8_9HEXA|nr:unnamed protein product [Allacma fusca]
MGGGRHCGNKGHHMIPAPLDYLMSVSKFENLEHKRAIDPGDTLERFEEFQKLLKMVKIEKENDTKGQCSSIS